MELGSLSRLLLARLATQLRGEPIVGRADAATSLSTNGAGSTTGALPQPAPLRTPATTTPPEPSTTLTPTGRLVARLLRSDPGAVAGEPAISSAQPIVDAGATPDQIAQSLARAVTESGLFYESHLLEWTQGKRDLASLLREPQASLPESTTRVPAAEKQAKPTPDADKASLESWQRTPEVQVRPERFEGDAIGARDHAMSGRIGESSSGAAPTDSRPPAAEPQLSTEAARIVRHQLEALAAEQLVWRGSLRLGEPGELEIGRNPRTVGEAGTDVWRARLSLELPHLGTVDVAIAIDHGSVALAFRADPASRAALAQQAASLHSALEAQALHVQGMQFLEPSGESGRSS